MSVSRAQREISSIEFTEWMAYETLEPFGPVREDQRAGVIAATLANINRDTKARQQPYSVEDFFPRYEDFLAKLAEATSPEPAANLESKLIAWAAAMNQSQPKAKPAKPVESSPPKSPPKRRRKT